MCSHRIETAFSILFWCMLFTKKKTNSLKTPNQKAAYFMDVWMFGDLISNHPFSCKDLKFIIQLKQLCGIFQVSGGDQDVKETMLKPPTPSHDCMRVLPHRFLLESTKCCVFCTLGESCFSQSQPTTHNFGDKKTNQKTLSTFFWGGTLPNFLFRKLPGKTEKPKNQPAAPQKSTLGTQGAVCTGTIEEDHPRSFSWNRSIWPHWL